MTREPIGHRSSRVELATSNGPETPDCILDFVTHWPDDAFVVRGGLFPDVESVFVSVCDAFEDGDGAVISVHVGRADALGSHEEFARVCREADIRNNKVRCSTVGRLRVAGFALVLDTSDGQPACHHHAIFTEPPSSEEARVFLGCFDSPIPNPAKQRR